MRRPGRDGRYPAGPPRPRRPAAALNPRFPRRRFSRRLAALPVACVAVAVGCRAADPRPVAALPPGVPAVSDRQVFAAADGVLPVVHWDADVRPDDGPPPRLPASPRAAWSPDESGAVTAF